VAWHQYSLDIPCRGRGTYDITGQVGEKVRQARVQTGLVHVFCRHTSASLMICENADPAVRTDLETLMARLAADGDPAFTHRSEGPDDMAAHARTVLTASELTVPVVNGRLGLGTWQGIYLWEHRRDSFTRQIVVTVQGE
jgi:secondary thiamine-phosphate synthase enzyme